MRQTRRRGTSRTPPACFAPSARVTQSLGEGGDPGTRRGGRQAQQQGPTQTRTREDAPSCPNISIAQREERSIRAFLSTHTLGDGGIVPTHLPPMLGGTNGPTLEKTAAATPGLCIDILPLSRWAISDVCAWRVRSNPCSSPNRIHALHSRALSRPSMLPVGSGGRLSWGLQKRSTRDEGPFHEEIFSSEHSRL